MQRPWDGGKPAIFERYQGAWSGLGRDRRRMVGDEAGEEAGDSIVQDLVGHGSANSSPGAKSSPLPFL